MMTKQEYRQARRTLRDNGNYALRWLRMAHASEMMRLQAIQARDDFLKIMQELKPTLRARYNPLNIR